MTNHNTLVAFARRRTRGGDGIVRLVAIGVAPLVQVLEDHFVAPKLQIQQQLGS